MLLQRNCCPATSKGARRPKQVGQLINPLAWLLTLPNDKGAPSKFLKARNISSVPRAVSGKLVRPVLATSFDRCRGTACFVCMPETAMHEHSDPSRRKYDVRPTRQMVSIGPKSVASPVKQRANSQFWFRVCRPDRAHNPASQRWHVVKWLSSHLIWPSRIVALFTTFRLLFYRKRQVAEI